MKCVNVRVCVGVCARAGNTNIRVCVSEGGGERGRESAFSKYEGRERVRRRG